MLDCHPLEQKLTTCLLIMGFEDQSSIVPPWPSDCGVQISHTRLRELSMSSSDLNIIQHLSGNPQIVLFNSFNVIVVSFYVQLNLMGQRYKTNLRKSRVLRKFYNNLLSNLFPASHSYPASRIFENRKSRCFFVAGLTLLSSQK